MAERIIKLPDVGEGVAEAEVSEWHVAVGDTVAEDQVLAAVTTDKVTVEIPSPVAGRVVALGAEAGSVLAVGAALVRLEVGEASERHGTPPQAAAPPLSQAPAFAHTPAPDQTTQAPAPAPARPALEDEKPMASPAVRRRAAEAGIDLRTVDGSGPGGRIRHLDLDRALQHAAAGQGRAVPPRPAMPEPAIPGPVQEIRLAGVRRATARRMAEATRRIAHFSYVEEVDMTAVEELRAALLRQPGAAGRPKLSPLPFIVLATVRAVADFPQMNARFDDEAEVIRRYGSVHAGIATQTDTGLLVPVLRDAGSLDLWGIGAGIARLGAAARENRVSREELAGSTITVSSLGALGGIAATPVINWPEVAIIGVNRLAIRPMWRDGGFVPRRMMNLSTSFDHRVVDGMEAALFVQRIKDLLETPALLLLP